MYSPSRSDSVSPLSPTLLPFPETSIWFTLKTLVISMLIENYDIDADHLDLVWEDFQDSEEASSIHFHMINEVSKRPEFPSIFSLAQEFSPEVLRILASIASDQDETIDGRPANCHETEGYFNRQSLDFAFFEKYRKRNFFSTKYTPFSRATELCDYIHQASGVSVAEVAEIEQSVHFPFNEEDWSRLLELERGSDGDVEAYIWKQLGHCLRQHAIAVQATVIGRDLGLSDYSVAQAIQAVQEPQRLWQIFHSVHYLPDMFIHAGNSRHFENMLDRAYGYLMQQSPGTAELWIRSHFTAALKEELNVLSLNSFSEMRFPLACSSLSLQTGLSLTSISLSTGSEDSVETPYEGNSLSNDLDAKDQPEVTSPIP